MMMMTMMMIYIHLTKTLKLDKFRVISCVLVFMTTAAHFDNERLFPYVCC